MTVDTEQATLTAYEDADLPPDEERCTETAERHGRRCERRRLADLDVCVKHVDLADLDADLLDAGDVRQ